MFATRGAAAFKTMIADKIEEPPLASEDPIPPLDDATAPATPITVLTLKDEMCRWPIGDVGEPEFHFCGRKSLGTLPYCEHHARLAYQPVQARRRERRSA